MFDKKNIELKYGWATFEFWIGGGDGMPSKMVRRAVTAIGDCAWRRVTL